MTDALAHRGPDGEGQLALGPLALGHRRLAVIDLSPLAAQPMRLEEAGLTLSYNGELYNYLELRAELQESGVRFRSESDTEVILQAYARWGEDAFRRFNGMWALALWDEKSRRLLLSRDRFGIKPLYVYECDELLAFASEPKAILAAFPEARALDEGVLARFLRSGLQDACQRTFFAKLRSVRPGHCLKVEDGVSRERSFWSLNPEEAATRYTLRRPADTLRELLADAVKLRLRSDVEVGICLSGGLDSSSIVALAAAQSERPLHSFTAVYNDPTCDERRYSRAVAERYGCLRAEVEPGPGSGLIPLLEQIVYHHDAPCSRPGLIAQWSVMQLAQREVTVLLDGQGGDELFCGYGHYALTYLRSLAARTLRRPSRSRLRKLVRDAHGLLTTPSTTSLGSGPLWRLLGRGVRKRLSPGELLVGPALRHAIAPPLPPAPAWTARSPIDRLQWQELTSSSLPALLRLEDRASMAFSLETRVPFLDHRLVEFAFALSFEEKVKGGLTKHVLREALQDRLPPEVVWRRDKQGYPVPIRRWILDSAAEGRPLLASLEARGVVPRGTVEQVWRQLEEGFGDPWLIYRWLTTEIWLRRFVDTAELTKP
jgi:asparagine synthase (glutamine-hydrolysing)